MPALFPCSIPEMPSNNSPSNSEQRALSSLSGLLIYSTISPQNTYSVITPCASPCHVSLAHPACIFCFSLVLLSWGLWTPTKLSLLKCHNGLCCYLMHIHTLLYTHCCYFMRGCWGCLLVVDVAGCSDTLALTNPNYLVTCVWINGVWLQDVGGAKSEPCRLFSILRTWTREPSSGNEDS